MRQNPNSSLRRKQLFSVLIVLIVVLINPWNFSWKSGSTNRNIQLLETKSGNDNGAVVQVLPTDIIMTPGWRNTAGPFVVESHKLIFFSIPKVACSVWKQLFRRMDRIDNWIGKKVNIHDPLFNGLKYLNQYSLQNATRFMNDPAYTKAIFVRDPKDRFLSAFLDKGLQQNGKHVLDRCCPTDKQCWPESTRTLTHFFKLTKACRDPHWFPMHERLDSKYLPLIDFVGSMDNQQEDSKHLLQTIGAWEDFGASGWGVNGTEQIFQSKSSVNHATSSSASDAWDRMKRYYTPELERAVEERFAGDYDTFNLPRKPIDFQHEII
mmetsp:Transcript_26499/g.63094  ORF Transcript_26499/g.63094 Transcript_26499/m.63094 type:complete len:322 (-) Transcript_26499:419-1384(-)